MASITQQFLVPVSTSSETQGRSVGSGERAGRKFSSTFRPAFSPDPTDCPWVSEDAVSMVSSGNAWHNDVNDALLRPKYEEKRAEKRFADYESRCLRKRD